MAKLTLTDVSAGYLSVATYNANNVLLEAALENTLSRDGTAPNTMSANLDLNSNKVVNVTDGTNNQDAVTLAQLTASVATPEGTAVKSTGVTDGYILTADGANASVWEAIPAHEGTTVLSTGVADGYVLTADGANASAWEAIPAVAGTDVTAVAITDGYVLTADGAGATAWEAVPSGGAPEGTSVLSTGPVTDGYVLTADGAGAAAWEAVPAGGISNVVEDTTPQLGGDLDLNSSDVTGTGNVSITGNISNTGNVEVTNVVPKIVVEQSGGSVDYKKWALGYATGNQLYFPRLLTDADVNGGYAFRISRTGTTTGLIEMGGTVFSMKDAQLNAAELLDYSISKQTETIASGVVTTSYNAGQCIEITLTENITTWAISSVSGSDRYGELLIKFVQDGTGSRTVAWGGLTVKWPAGAAPTITPTATTGTDLVSLKTFDGGTTWYGNVSQDFS